MLKIVLLAQLVALATAAPASGTCMCVNTAALHVRDQAGLSSNVVATASSGECYKFNGGVITKDGYTWYELQNVHGHSRVWAASNYLTVSPASHCGSSGSTGSHSFATGVVSQHCLECICQQESGCTNKPCADDVGSLSCGYFQIKHDYWLDCGSIGGSWKACAADLHCASQCVQNYMKRWASHYNCPLTCEGYSREHNGGPNGCHHSSTLGYWTQVKTHSGCAHVQ
ncbi:LYS-like protein [Mya arenaria]|uniref:lysozyme n=1 Tax=Mya arenaria TaxID=6604 RepID=A0ABY7E025_MYAAR|nr:lysozyme-like [Mya arenaria]WAR03343.1 LYS-like protein [Mya arenaria]